MAGQQSRPTTAQSTSRPRLLRCIALTALMFVVAIGIAVLIIWLVIKPAPLEYTVEDAHIRGFNITNDNKLNATVNLRLMADNRNKKVSMYYDSIVVSVFYEDREVAFSELVPFYQPSRNATAITTSVTAVSRPLDDQEAKDIRHDRSSGKVELAVQVKARIRFKVARIKSRHYTLKAYCSPVIVYFNSNTQFQRSYCDVDT